MTKSAPAPAIEAIDIQDGIPDRAASSDRWRVAKVVGIYLAWIGVLAYMLLGGLPESPVLPK
ncbi:MAG: hypothetical protein HN909_05110 [Phycisphaerales bacterium]|jgi:hypothetical protein|nr:hypothetical protein [Phycisphaerales bacterium]MBT7171131.1 hypothetical protein [Phycisphaerales bacterium]